MLASFSEFKFYQSFRIPVEEADDLRFLVQIERGRGSNEYIDDAKLIDISLI
jgi:two-component system response regulator HydG